MKNLILFLFLLPTAIKAQNDSITEPVVNWTDSLIVTPVIDFPVMGWPPENPQIYPPITIDPWPIDWGSWIIVYTVATREEGSINNFIGLCLDSNYCFESICMNPDQVTTKLQVKKDTQLKLYRLDQPNKSLAYAHLSAPISISRGYYEWTYIFNRLPESTFILEIESGGEKKIARIEARSKNALPQYICSDLRDMYTIFL